MRTFFGLALAVMIAGALGVLTIPRLHAEGRGAILYAAAVAGDETETRITLDITRDVEARAFVLDAPDRLVLDMANVGFALAPGEAGQGDGLVLRYRYGLLAPGRSRIVADLAGPAVIVSQDRAATAEGSRLTVTLRPASGDPLLLPVSGVPLPPAFDRNALRATSPPRSDRLESTIADPAAANGSGPIVVVIDPGHGGIDSGATSRNGALEKDIVLAFSRTLRDAIDSDPRFEAVLTRDEDLFIPLGERVAFAREKYARLFISIHADAVREAYVRGATVYTLSERASDARAAALANKENRVDMLAGLPMSDDAEVADILLDLARRETKNFSILAARQLVGNLRGATRLNKNPLRSARFKVLRAPDVPSVLLELGYLSNDDDAERFGDLAWREKTAGRIAEAVADYFGMRGVAAASSRVHP